MEEILRKKILIHSIVFYPDGVSTAYLYNDIAIALKEEGYDVTVLTTTPHYNYVDSPDNKKTLRKKLFGIYSFSLFNGIKVYHIPQRKFKNPIIRMFSFIYWHLYSFFFGLFINRISAIISPSPPLTIGIVSLLLAKFKGAKFLYNVQEIYPDLLINKGLRSKPIITLLKKLEYFVYNTADSITTINEDFLYKVQERTTKKSKVKLIPNFVDTELYKPFTKPIKLPEQFVTNKENFILMYAGNIGFYQDWEPIVYAAKKLIHESIEFWIIGNGVLKDDLHNIVNEESLNNIKVFPYQERTIIPQLINHADINFISINKELETEGFPSKIYTIMACAKPIILIAGNKSPINNFLKDKDCSVIIEENRNENFVKSIRHLMKNSNEIKRLGKNGFDLIKKEYSKDKVLSKYIETINDLT